MTKTATTTAEPLGCHYRGKFHLPGSVMSSGYDVSSNWCYWTICDASGGVIYADNFKCKIQTTTPEPISARTSIPATERPVHD